MRISLACLCVVAAAPAACKSDSKPTSKKVTVASTTDATEALVDDDYRFRIDWPGKGWKLMREDEIRRVSPDAVAGAINTDARTYGAVIVESATSANLEGMAKLIMGARPLEDAEPGPMRPTTFAGAEAIRFEMKGRVQGVPMVMDTIVFLHQDHAYQLVAWSADGGTTATFDRFFDSFALTEGDVVGRTAKTVSAAQGVGWRVVDGVFESAVAGLRIRPAHDYRLTVGEELAQTNPDAEVGWTRTLPHEVFGQLIIEPSPAKQPSESYVEGIKQSFLAGFGATLAGESKVATIGSADVTFDLARATDPVGLSVYHGVLINNGMIAQIIFWSLSASEGALWASVEQGLETIEILSADDAQALRAQLLTVRDAQNTVTSTSSLRGGVFRDFAGGWSWKRPAGFWRLRAGAGARAVDPAASLYLEEPSLGVYATIGSATTNGSSPDAFHREVLDVMGLSPEGVTSRTIAGAEARASLVEVVDPKTKIAGSYYTTTITRGDRAVIASFWGSSGHMQTDALSAVVDQIRLHDAPMPAVETDGATYRDVRMGYEVTISGSGWRFKDETPPPFAELGSIVSWNKGGKQFGVITLNAIAVDQDAEWFTDFVEQLFRDQVSGMTSTPPTRSDTTLDGLPARELVWESGPNRLQLFIANRDRTFYAIMVLGKNLGIDAHRAFMFVD